MKKNFTALLTLTVLCIAVASYAQEPAATAAPSLADEVNALKRELALLKSQCADDARMLVPVGVIVAYFGESVPDGWLLCDGKTKLDEPQYDELRKLIGDTVPDLRGYFLRGLDPEGNVDPEGKTRKLGVAQADLLKAHRHTGNTGSNGAHVHTGGSLIKSAVESEKEWRGKYKATPTGFDNDSWNDRRYSPTGEPNIRRVYPMNQSASHTHSITPEGGAETRPQNKAVNYIIRY